MTLMLKDISNRVNQHSIMICNRQKHKVLGGRPLVKWNNLSRLWREILGMRSLTEIKNNQMLTQEWTKQLNMSNQTIHWSIQTNQEVTLEIQVSQEWLIKSRIVISIHLILNIISQHWAIKIPSILRLVRHDNNNSKKCTIGLRLEESITRI